MKNKCRYIIALVVAFMIFASFGYNVKAEEVIDDRDSMDIQVVENPYDRSLLEEGYEGLKSIYNGIANTIEGTYYDELKADKFIINGIVFEKSEIKSKTTELKNALKSRKKKGLKDIIINTTKGREYYLVDYIRYLARTIENRTIDKDTIWTKEQGPYYINGEILVKKGSTLTIEKGTNVYFENTPIKANDSGIIVEGSLVVNGEENSLVEMNHVNSDASSGSWKGIYVAEEGSAKINYAKIEKAGFWSDSTIYSFGNVEINNSVIENTYGSGITSFGNISVSNSEILNNKKLGINVYVKDKNAKVVIKENKFQNNDVAARTVYRNGYSENFDISDNITQNNNINGIQLYGDISGDMVFTKAGTNVPYVIPGDSVKDGVNQELRINKNSTVNFNSAGIKFQEGQVGNVKSKIQVDGVLNLLGTSTDKMVITSVANDDLYGDTNNDGNNTTPKVGTYQNIEVSEIGKLSVNYANISYGGAGQSPSGANIVNRGNAKITNSTVKNCYTGIYSEGDLNLNRNRFSYINLYGLYLAPNNKSINFQASNNTFAGFNNYFAKIFIQNGGIQFSNTTGNILENCSYEGALLIANINYDTKIAPLVSNVPYVIPNRSTIIDGKVDKDYDDFTVASDKVLNIDAGTILKMDRNKGGCGTNMLIDGTLRLNGTSNDRIYITSIYDDSIGGHTSKRNITYGSKGDWNDIKIGGTGGETIINNSVISYGGIDQTKPTISIIGDTSINNSLIEHLEGTAINIKNGDVSLNKCTFNDITGQGIVSDISDSKDMNLNASDNVFSNVTYTAIKLNGTVGNFNSLGNNNVAVDNGINGCDLNLIINGQSNIKKLGDKFPYTIQHSLEVNSDAILDVDEDTSIKSEVGGDIDVRGVLNLNGTSDKPVILTSLYDSSVAGNTNNTNLTDNVREWPGLTIHDKGTVSINNAKDLYSEKSFNFDRVSLIKAYSAENNLLVECKEGAVYVKKDGNNQKVVYYDKNEKSEKEIYNVIDGKVIALQSNEYIIGFIIEDNSKIKRKLVLYDTSEFENNKFRKIMDKEVACIDSELADNLSIGKDYVLCGKYEVFKTSNGEKISVDFCYNEDESIKVDETFKPVIYDDKIIYRIIKTDDNNEEYKEYESYEINSDDHKKKTMILRFNRINGGESSSSNLTFLSGVDEENLDRVIVINTDKNLIKEIFFEDADLIQNPNIYRDLISVSINEERSKFVVIKSTNNENVTDKTVVAAGHGYGEAVSGDSLSSFIQGSLVYNMTTDISTDKTQFYTPTDSYNDEYFRSYDIEAGSSMSFGVDLGEDKLAELCDANITLGKSVASAIIVKNTQGIVNNIIGFQRSKTESASGNISIGLKAADDKIEVGPSLELNKEYKAFQADSYYFGGSASDFYKNVGKLLIGSALDGNGILDFGPIGKLINFATTQSVLKSDSLQGYDISTGIGISAGASGGINANVGKYVEAGVNAGVNAEALLTLGQSVEKNSTENYVSIEFGIEGDFSSNIGIDLPEEEDDEDNGGLIKDVEISVGEISNKIPESVNLFEYEKQGKMLIKMKINWPENSCEIGFCDYKELENGFVKTYYYTIKGEDFIKLCANVPYIYKLNSSKEGVIDTSTDYAANVFVKSLIDQLSKLSTITYRVEGEKSLGKDNAEAEVELNCIADAAVGLNLGYEEKISIVLDSGVIVDGVATSEMCGISFIEKDKSGIITVLGNIAEGLYSELAPTKSKFTNNQATYTDKGHNVVVENTTGYSSALFYDVPLYFDSDLTTKDIGEGKTILENGVYIELKDKDNKKVSTTTGTTLNMYKDIDKDNIYQYGLFYYNESDNKWEYVGGTNTVVGDKVKVSLEITKTGQYAIGKVDTPAINISINGNCPTLNPKDVISISTEHQANYYYKNYKMVVELKDDTGAITTLNNSSSNGNQKSYNYTIPSQSTSVERKYTLIVKIVDTFGNEKITSREFIISK